MKKNRQQKILELISNTPIGTQDELIARLKENGYDATQATVSRDIRALKLVKVLSEDGGYRYTLPQRTEVAAPGQGDAYQRGFNHSVLSVAYSMNNVVIKTTPGMASAIALQLDRVYHDMMLGTVAGDDTIIVVTRSVEHSQTLAQCIEEQKQ